MKNLIFIAAIMLSVGLKAQKCTQRLEEDLKQLPSWMLASSTSTHQGLDSECIETAMDAFSSWTNYITNKKIKNGDEVIGHYIYCSEEGFERTSTPHCKTPNYVNSIKNSYNAIIDCLELKSDDLYPIIAAESGFHLNSLSTIGQDIGLGQLTTPAITDVNAKWDEFLSSIRESNSKSCQNILAFVEKENLAPVDDDLSCALTDTPKNPLHNLIYSGFYFKLTKEYIDYYFNKSDIVARIDQYRQRYMSKNEIDKLKSLLVNLSYNMGFPNSAEAFEGYIANAEKELNEKFLKRKNISIKMAQNYFETEQLLNLGDTKNANVLLKLREKLKDQYIKIQNEIEVSSSIQMFGINSEKDSFGSYLKDQGLSGYLQLLQRRVTYISDKSRNKNCSIINHLQF